MPNPPVILYVEDDPASITIMKVILEKIMHIHTLTVFQGSENFMEKVSALPTQPDVFILDIHMKPFDGYELLSMLRSDGRFQSSRIIALTASVMGEEVDRLKATGFDGAISKPLSIRLFPGLFERVLRGEPVWFIS